MNNTRKYQSCKLDCIYYKHHYIFVISFLQGENFCVKVVCPFIRTGHWLSHPFSTITAVRGLIWGRLWSVSWVCEMLEAWNEMQQDSQMTMELPATAWYTGVVDCMWFGKWNLTFGGWCLRKWRPHGVN